MNRIDSAIDRAEALSDQVSRAVSPPRGSTTENNRPVDTSADKDVEYPANSVSRKLWTATVVWDGEWYEWYGLCDRRHAALGPIEASDIGGYVQCGEKDCGVDNFIERN